MTTNTQAKMHLYSTVFTYTTQLLRLCLKLHTDVTISSYQSYVQDVYFRICLQLSLSYNVGGCPVSLTYICHSAVHFQHSNWFASVTTTKARVISGEH